MNSSTSSAQDVQKKTQPDQPVTQVQPAPTQPVQTPPKTQISVPGGIESGQAMIVAESPDADEEDEVLVAPQETKSQVVMGQGGGEESDEQQIVSQPSVADIQAQSVEVQPSVPEVVSNSPEVEKIVEKSPDQEKPDIPKVVQDAGVTHSGPGVIDVKQNAFGIKKMPVTYQKAAVEEKVTELHDSKHWLMGMVMYIWRKVNPNLGKKGAVVVKRVPVAATQNKKQQVQSTVENKV